MELLEFDASHWMKWAAPGAGILAAGLALACGLLVSRRRGCAAAMPPQRDPAPVAPGGPERRKTIRRGGTAVAVLISDAEGKAPPHQGWVLDRSTVGLRLAASQPATVGATLGLRPCDAAPGVAWIQVEVTNSHKSENGWEVGCRFLQTPPWDLLLLFG